MLFRSPIETALQPAAGVFFSKNGLQYPIPLWESGHWLTLPGLAAGCVGAWARTRHTRQHLFATGVLRPSFWPGVLIVLAGGVLGWLIGGAPGGLDVPEKTELNVVGGGAVTPEFLTMLIGLTIYTASYIAEIVRGGIQAVPFGQHEAAAALGL